MKVDPAILQALGLAEANVSQSGMAGGDSSAQASRLTAKLDNGTTRNFFVKTGSGPAAATMFKGEHASLKAIHDAVPTLCPAPLGQGALQSSPSKHFLVTEFIDMSASGPPKGETLAQKLAKLHTTPAPTPQGHDSPMFGFPVTTCCGDTPQPNSFTNSWADFFAEHRLRYIWRQCVKNQGGNEKMEQLVNTTIDRVIPHLLGPDRLKIKPVVVHGDLWSGNAGVGKLDGAADNGHIVFDPSAFYGHSEYDHGIMNMFGGFGSVLSQYRKLVPKSEPEEEYEDRVKLYEVFHHLNHHAMFGGGYRGGAERILSGLVSRYGNTRTGEL